MAKNTKIITNTKNTDKTTKPWGTTAGAVISALILLAVTSGVIAATMFYGIYKTVQLTVDDISTVSASTDIQGDTAVSTLKIKVAKKGYRLDSYESRIDGNCMYLKLYASIGGEYEPDSDGVTTLTFNTDRDINYIRMESNKQKKDLMLITWSETVDTDDLVYVSGKLTDENFLLTLKLSDSARHICSYKGETVGDKYVILVESSNIIADYEPNAIGAYELALPVKTEHKSIWASDGKNEIWLCDIEWPEVAKKADLNVSVAEVAMKPTSADVVLEVELEEGVGYLWTFDEVKESGVSYVTLYKNSIPGDMKPSPLGVYTVKINVGNAINEIVIRYADGDESIYTLEWPSVVNTADSTVEYIETAIDGTVSFSLSLADETLYYFDCDSYTEGNKLFVRVYSSKYETEQEKDANGKYSFSVSPSSAIDFIVLLGGEEKTIYATGKQRLLGGGDVSVKGYTLDGNKLTVQLAVEKEGFFLDSHSVADDGARLMLSLYGSSAEGEPKADADGIYTLVLDVKDSHISIVQEVEGDEKLLIENIRA